MQKKFSFLKEWLCLFLKIPTLSKPPVPQNEPHGLDVVHGRIIPEMLQQGVTQETIERITVKNIVELYRG